LEEWLSSNSIDGISLDDGTDAELIYRARAALAQAAPQGPTDEEIDQLWDEVGEYFALYSEVRQTIRAALRRWGCQ
jgi:hypothetical protein